MLQGSVLNPVEAHSFWNGTFSPGSRRLLLNTEGRSSMLPGEPLALPQSRNRIGYLNRFLWLDQMYYLPDDILNKSDRMSMAHSLEVRPPFLDHRIVEFAARLPQNLKIRGGTLKFLLRRLMQDRLPEPVLRRKKKASTSPRTIGCAPCCVHSCWIRSTSAASAKPASFRGPPSRPPSARTWIGVLTSVITYGGFWFCSSG